jgi:alkylation response protein AidB-like acyl-CoA dehydrogenase
MWTQKKHDREGQMKIKEFNGNSSQNSADLIGRIRQLHPLLRRNAVEGETQRRVAEETIRALTDTGAFKIAVPKRYGGYQANVRSMLDVSAAVAEADGGAGWVVALTNVCAWLAGLYPEKAQDDVFGGDPNARITGVLAPTAEAKKVAGGYRITGRWYYNSGSLHATWAVLGFPVLDEKGVLLDQGLALIPMSDAKLEETWFVAGMRSTGSNCITVQDAFVPEYRILSVPPAIEGKYASERLNEEAFYRSAFVPTLALILVGPQLGMGRAALEFVKDKASSRAISYTFFEKQNLSVGFQLQIAEAAMLIDTATLHAYRAAADIDDAANSGAYLDYFARARVRADTSLVVERITQAIDLLLFAHGAGSFAEASPLQRIWRDSAVAARHAVVLPAVGYEIYGKALLGIEEKITPLV